MDKIHPISLRPLIGYLMWYLEGERGRPPRQYTHADAVEKAKLDGRFDGYSEEEFQTALTWALRNLGAAQNAKVLADSKYQREQQ